MKSSFKIGSVIGLVGLIAFLAFKAYDFREKNRSLEWLLFAKQAEVDTLKVIAEYSVVETVLVSRVRIVTDTLEGKIIIDTVYEDIPAIYGSIKIDTTRDFGPGSNPLKIRVAGEFWYPPEYSNRNWMLIHPVMGSKMPYLPPERRSRDKWGLGLTYSRSLSDGSGMDYMGISGRYRRLSLACSYDFWKKAYLGTISYEPFTF